MKMQYRGLALIKGAGTFAEVLSFVSNESTAIPSILW
jgi:hypothetical protein